MAGLMTFGLGGGGGGEQQFDPTSLSLGLMGIADFLKRRQPRYSTNIADVSQPDDSGMRNTLGLMNYQRQLQRDKLAEAETGRRNRLADIQIGRAQREMQGEQELGDAASSYLSRNPMQTTNVNPQGLPTLPDAYDATRVGIPGTGGAANPTGLLKDPNYLATMARRYPTQFATMASKKPNMVSVAPGASLYNEDTGDVAFTNPDRSHFPPGYQPGADNKLTHIPGGPADPAVIGTQARAREAEAYRERDFPLPGGQIQKQFSRDRGMSWQPFGDTYDRRADRSGATPTQQARNMEIDSARRVLEDKGLSHDAILNASKSATATGRDNPNYDPQIARLARLASRRKVAEPDDDFEQTWQRVYHGLGGDTGGQGGGGARMPQGAGSVLGPSGSVDLGFGGQRTKAPVPMRGGKIDHRSLRPGTTYDDGKGGSWRWNGMDFEAVE